MQYLSELLFFWGCNMSPCHASPCFSVWFFFFFFVCVCVFEVPWRVCSWASFSHSGTQARFLKKEEKKNIFLVHFPTVTLSSCAGVENIQVVSASAPVQCQAVLKGQEEGPRPHSPTIRDKWHSFGGSRRRYVAVRMTERCTRCPPPPLSANHIRRCMSGSIFAVKEWIESLICWGLYEIF